MDNMITIDTEIDLKPSYKPYELVPEEDPILKKLIPKFDFDSGIDTEELSGRLKQTLIESRAYGVAAPQCGLEYRVFCMGAEGNFITMFNPSIIYTSDETVHLEEGCLSFPFLILSITRPRNIKVSYQDEKGNSKEISLTDISARVAQHEIDHLNGRTFQTVAKPLALKTALKRREKLKMRFIRNVMASNIMKKQN